MDRRVIVRQLGSVQVIAPISSARDLVLEIAIIAVWINTSKSDGDAWFPYKRSISSRCVDVAIAYAISQRGGLPRSKIVSWSVHGTIEIPRVAVVRLIVATKSRWTR